MIIRRVLAAAITAVLLAATAATIGATPSSAIVDLDSTGDKLLVKGLYRATDDNKVYPYFAYGLEAAGRQYGFFAIKSADGFLIGKALGDQVQVDNGSAVATFNSTRATLIRFGLLNNSRCDANLAFNSADDAFSGTCDGVDFGGEREHGVFSIVDLIGSHANPTTTTVPPTTTTTAPGATSLEITFGPADPNGGGTKNSSIPQIILENTSTNGADVTQVQITVGDAANYGFDFTRAVVASVGVVVTSISEPLPADNGDGERLDTLLITFSAFPVGGTLTFEVDIDGDGGAADDDTDYRGVLDGPDPGNNSTITVNYDDGDSIDIRTLADGDLANTVDEFTDTYPFIVND